MVQFTGTMCILCLKSVRGNTSDIVTDDGFVFEKSDAQEKGISNPM